MVEQPEPTGAPPIGGDAGTKPPEEHGLGARAGALLVRHQGTLVAIAGLAGLLAVGALVVFVADDGPPPPLAAAAIAASTSSAMSASPTASQAPPPTRGESAAVAASAGPEDAGPPQGDAGEAAADAGGDDVTEPEPDPSKTKKKKAFAGTVEKAAAQSCSTSSVDGLSRQIVAEARCLDAKAFARVPARKNLAVAGNVFLYLDAPARDGLVRALDAQPGRTMKVHSALRTVAQQYLLYRWASSRRCGITLATRPGESNHETGLALDIGGHAGWRPALEAAGFRWLGPIDKVHFDFKGPGVTHHEGLDVHAFQRLWNRNHPDDTIAETHRFDAATAARLKSSPARGFPTGATCGRGSSG